MNASLNVEVKCTAPHQDMREDLLELEQTHTALTEDFQALQSKHQDLEEDYDILTDKYDELYQDHAEATKDLLAVCSKKRQLKCRVADLEDDYAELQTEMAELKAEHENLLQLYNALLKQEPHQMVSSKYKKRRC